MMNRSRKAILAVATITSLTLGSSVAVAQENTKGSTSSSQSQNSSGSSNGSSNSKKTGDKQSQGSVQELSTDEDGEPLTLIGKLAVIKDVLTLVGAVLLGAFGIYETITKIQKAMEN